MATTRRKKVLVRPPRKPRLATKGQKAVRKAITSHILLEPPPRTSAKRRKKFFSAQYQLLQTHKKLRLSKDKYTRPGKVKALSKEQRKALTIARSRKTAKVKEYNSQLKKALKGRYQKHEIKHALKYTPIGKKVAIEKAKVYVQDIRKAKTKDKNKYKVDGKWISHKQLNLRMKAAIRRGRIKGYMEVAGLTKAQAKRVLAIFEKGDNKILIEKWRAIIY